MFSATVQIEGLTCEACGKLAERYIKKKVEGIKAVEIDAGSGKAVITSNREITIDEINASLQGTDYKAKEIN